MRNKLFLASLVLGSIALSGCSSTLKAPELNQVGRFETGSEIKPEDVQVVENFDKEKWSKMVVVGEFTENNQVNDFYYNSISNSGKFETVYNKGSLEKYVLENKIEGVTDASSLLSLNNMAKTTGPFLLVKPYFVWNGGYNFEASLEAIDVTTGNAVFRADKKAFNWGGLDKPLFYPLFNSLMDWVDGKYEVNTKTVIRPDLKKDDKK